MASADERILAGGSVAVRSRAEEDIATAAAASTKQQQHAYLGGGNINKVQDHFACTVYKNFPRPVKLPPPSFKLKKSMCKDAKSAFLELWNGNFDADWFVRQNKSDDSSTFAMKVKVPETGSENKYAGVTVASVEMFVESNGTTHVNPEMREHNAEFCASFPEEFQFDLLLRLLHQFLREQGWHLMANAESAVMIKPYSRFLFDRFAKETDLVEDVAVAATDISINYGYEERYALVRLGEVVGLRKAFLEEAEIYMYSANVFCPTTDPSMWQDHSKIKMFAGLALKQSNQFDKAEEAYLSSLHYHMKAMEGDLNLNTEEFRCLSKNVFTLYSTWYANPECRRILPIYLTVIYVCGFDSGLGPMCPYTKIGTKYWPKLKKTYRKKEGAVKLLIEATSSPDRAQFHRVLNNCMLSNTNFSYHQSMFAPNQSAGEARRRELKYYEDKTPNFRCGYKNCSNVRERKSQLLCCPCKSISYCQKECQVSDWKEHKLVCPYQLKKTAKKEKK